MLELPESNTITRQINQVLKGKVIKEAVADYSPHGFAFYNGDPMEYPFKLLDRSIESAAALGGMIEIDLGDNALRFGDGVNIRYYEEGSKLPAKHQLHITFNDNTQLICTIAMYGGIWVYRKGETDGDFYYTVAKEKPSPLSEGFNQEYFSGIVAEARKKKTISIKALLATEQRIPGLGNGCLHDILFNARLNPRTKLASITDEQLEELYRCVKNTLSEMTEKGGRNTEKDLFAVQGGYKTILSSKTYKYPCPVCGNLIIRKAYLGGNVYYCPVCQPENFK